MAFVKLDQGLLDSTIWREPAHVNRVWIALLLLCDQNGNLTMPIPGLADRARVTLDQCEDALERLAAPDKHSRTKAHEGRRIRELGGGEVGWHLYNYENYRKKDHTQAERAKRYRERKKQERVTRDVTVSHGASQPVTDRTQADADADADAEAEAKAKEEALKNQPPPPIENDGVGVGGAAVWPDKREVDALVGKGPEIITQEMADAYFDSREAAGWNVKGVPVVNWQADFRQFCRYWRNNEKRDKDTVKAKEEKNVTKGWDKRDEITMEDLCLTEEELRQIREL